MVASHYWKGGEAARKLLSVTFFPGYSHLIIFHDKKIFNDVRLHKKEGQKVSALESSDFYRPLLSISFITPKLGHSY